MNEIHRY